MPNRPKKHFFGKKGLNRVVVYQHARTGAWQITWYDGHGERFRKSIGRYLGVEVVHDEEVAIEAGRKLAHDLAGSRRAEQMARASGTPIRRTIGALLERYHFDKDGEWSETHRAAQDRHRAFFEEVFDSDLPVDAITPAKVQSALKKAAQERGWGKRSMQAYIVYIKSVYRYAWRMLRWVDDRHDLRELKAPSVRSTKSDAYSIEEVRGLLEHAESYDLRIAAAIRIALITGRRSSAICNLTVDDVTQKNGRPALNFSAATDKAGKEGLAIIDDATADLVTKLLNQTRVISSGQLFPSGNLAKASRSAKPLKAHWMSKAIKAVEELAGIEHVTGRGLHGLKRTMATLASDRKAASKQTGTNQATLERYYEKEDYEAVAKIVDEIAEVVG